MAQTTAAYDVRDFRDDEAFIASATVSEARTYAFLRGYGEYRVKTATTEALFRHAGAFTQIPERRRAAAFGFDYDAVLHKAPFVDGSRWFPYDTWEIAVAAVSTQEIM